MTKRIAVLSLGAILSLAAVAQSTPGAESNNSNQEAPALNAPGMSPKASQSPKPEPKQTAPATNAPSENNTGATPAQPTTVMLPDTGEAQPSADPLLQSKPLPEKPMSLIGGTVAKVDRIRNRVQVQPFGTKRKIEIRFDDRSHIYRDGRETTLLGIKQGDRIYADTLLYDRHIFAQNLRIITGQSPAESRGQVSRTDGNRVTITDGLTGQAITFDVSPQTQVDRRGSKSTLADLKPGSLVDVQFVPGGAAKKVSVLAVPGEEFIFSGRITDLNLSTGVLAVDNESDQKNYELHFNPATLRDQNGIRIGTEISARAKFNGRSYDASQIAPMTASAEE